MQIFLYFKRMQLCNSTICDSLAIHLWHYYVKTFNILELGWREEKRTARRGRGISNVHPVFLLVTAQLFWLLIGSYIWRTNSTNCWARKFSRTWRNSLKLPSGRHNWLADRLIGIKISLHGLVQHWKERYGKTFGRLSHFVKNFSNFWY